MPIVPIEIQDGVLRGVWPELTEVQRGGRTVTVAQQDIGGTTYSSTWFQYCGLQGFPSVQPAADADNRFLATSGYEWLEDIEEGEPLRVEMFDDYESWGNGIGRSGLGKPARGTWRNMEDSRPVPIQVLRTPELPRMINGEGRYSSIP
ncbi:MAG: ubiquinol-cytochrome c reductase iron-sulfur subunit, partial [Salinirussus sp.]